MFGARNAAEGTRTRCAAVRMPQNVKNSMRDFAKPSSLLQSAVIRSCRDMTIPILRLTLNDVRRQTLVL